MHKTQNLPIGDFPTDLNAFGSKLRELNFTKFSKIKQKQLDLGAVKNQFLALTQSSPFVRADLALDCPLLYA